MNYPFPPLQVKTSIYNDKNRQVNCQISLVLTAEGI